MQRQSTRGWFERLEERRVLATTLAINAGGPTVGEFVADQFFTDGGTFGPNNNGISPISLASVADPAPAAVYETERTGVNGTAGDFGYTIPGLIPGNDYELRLHFAEIFFESAGARVFDVLVNDQAVPLLDDYDVFAASGDPGAAAEQAVIEEFTVTADASGELRLTFLPSVNNAKLSGLELTGVFADSEPDPEPDPPPGAGPRVLFVRGEDRSGGFLEANNDFGRTEQLSDIFNTATFGGNHGWNELRLTLEGANFNVEQITEGVEEGSTTGPTDGVHIDFETLNLDQYDAIVFGSNNAVYDTAAVDAIEGYLRGGGGALFISDANFGGDWADASNSDQQFLDRFGLRANQDQGTYSLTRANGEFLVPGSPLFGGVNQIDGEGVTPIEIVNPGEFGVDVTLLALAEGNTRSNLPPFSGDNQGQSRSAGPNDAAVFTASAGAGRIAGHFDRNTFFNQNGAGTNINRFDSQQYALNLFGFLVGAFQPLLGDYDDSGVVDAADQAAFAEAFGETGDNAADGNGDSIVNAADYTVLRDLIGTRIPNVDLTLPQGLAAASLPAAILLPPVVSGEEEADALPVAATALAIDDALVLLIDEVNGPVPGQASEATDLIFGPDADDAADSAVELAVALTVS